MSTRREPNEPTARAPGALRVLIGAVAIVLLVGYPLLMREALRASGADASLVVALLKLPPVVINAALAWTFLASLGARREPVIARFARLEQGPLADDLVRYTRRLTSIWGGLFVVMAVVCLVLATPAMTLAWQWWTGVGQWTCVAALFIGERVYRKRRFAHYAHASLGRQLAIVVRHWRP